MTLQVYLGASYLKKTSRIIEMKITCRKNLSLGYIEKNVPTERDKYRNNVFNPGFRIIGAKKKGQKLKTNKDEQKVKTLV